MFQKLLKNKKIIQLGIIVIIIYSIFCSFLLFTINYINFPETEIIININEISTDFAIVNTTLNIKNPNQHSMIIRNLEIVAMTINDEKISTVFLEGGEISPNSLKKFNSVNKITFDKTSPDLLKSKITGEAGVIVFGYEKVLPFEINVVTSFVEIIENFAIPEVNFKTSFDEINNDEIKFSIKIEMNNNNTFDIYVKNALVNIENEFGKNLGKIDITDCTIRSKNSSFIEVHGNISLDVLNAEEIFIKYNSEVGAIMAGLNQVLPVSSETIITVPNLDKFIPSDSSIDTALKTDIKLTLRGLLSDITFEINNPTKMSFIVNELIIEYYRVDNNMFTLLTNSTIEGGDINAEDMTYFNCQINIPYSKFLQQTGKFFPDWYFVRVKAKISLPGINQFLWIGAGAYIDINMLF